MIRRPKQLIIFALVTIILIFFGCSGGGGNGSSQGPGGGGSVAANFGCDGACAHQSLSAAEVVSILQNFLTGASSLGVAGTIAIVDRLGNVLALYQMPGAIPHTIINGQVGASGGLEGRSFPASLAAISKAGTGAFLSSQGNAFSTRTASQIIQENFDPGEEDQPAGPLFGVQFSQLICSDIHTAGVGPKALPLGLSADPGGLPLYKSGDVVGGVGVELDGSYTLDRDIQNYDNNVEETLSLYASRGFEAPAERTAENINAAGKSLRYTDIGYDDLTLPFGTPALESSSLIKVSGFTNGLINPGSVYGSAASGVVLTSRAGVPASVLVDGGGNVRYPTRAGRVLASNEVDAILDSAILTAFRTRAAIRTPRDSQAHVSIFVVDVDGSVLGMTRTFDGPIFGIDVALQKARTAAFFSSSSAGAQLSAAGLGSYVQIANAFVGQDIFSGHFAFTSRSIGNLARPFFPDGIAGNPNGPFSKPFPGSAPGASWSPFNTGLQFDLIADRITSSGGCANSSVFGGSLANGIQIFAGSVPLYKDNIFAGAIGVSGDGIDQDDMIAFQGASRAGLDAASHGDIGDSIYGFNVLPDRRADLISATFDTTRLRYINCPEGPYRGSDDQNVCAN